MTISNDGATIVELLDVIRPAAKTLVEIGKSQDAEVRNTFKTALKKQRSWLHFASFPNPLKIKPLDGVLIKVLTRGAGTERPG